MDLKASSVPTNNLRQTNSAKIKEMNWLRWFAFLVIAVSYINAEGPKKKIRIHLPQKVKHIHHHKKIYITNHAASPEYAPAYMPSAEGAVAVPTNIAVPTVARIVPLSSMELYDESYPRLPRISSTGSKLLPLYRTRGYYGPSHSDWRDQKYDLVPPPDPNYSRHIPTGFTAPSGIRAPPPYRSPKRVKMIKQNEPKHKITGRKTKLQKNVIRGRPNIEEEHPVSSFHEMFYSDLDGTGTIKKIKKPQRVEKIVDGDTEHIHTYSEEHIHKLIYDETKAAGLIGADAMSSISGLSTSHRLIPFKPSQTLLAFPSDSLPGFKTTGSLGTPTNLEYAAYNPRDVTHDHIFHDHGEIPAHVDIYRDPLSYPPKISYNSQGLPIGGVSNPFKNKYSYSYKKNPTGTPSSDLSYYESISTNPHKTVLKPSRAPSQNDYSGSSIEDYDSGSIFNHKEKGSTKSNNLAEPFFFNSVKHNNNNHLPQANFPSPFSIPSSAFHDYKSKNYGSNLPGLLESSKSKDSLTNFKDSSSYSNNFQFDTLASPSNVLTTGDKNKKSRFRNDKKKSISSQNISYRGLDHQTTIDHLGDFGLSAISANEDSTSSLEDYYNSAQSELTNTATSTPFTLKETSPVHPYYSAMAIKALHGDDVVADSSNNNFQYVQIPNPSTTPHASSVVTIANILDKFKEEQTSTYVTSKPIDSFLEPKTRPRFKNRNSAGSNRPSRQKYLNTNDKLQLEGLNTDAYAETSSELHHRPQNTKDKRTMQSSNLGNLKYGDKI